MRRLREALSHTCVFSQIEPDGVRVVHTLSGKSSIEIGVKAGSPTRLGHRRKSGDRWTECTGCSNFQGSW
ncbi:MAG: hypothetical protein JKX93_17675 [Rhizobiaceae bacterium]|nr:hypothetical protein [Rhizobiaceae bacterium]